MTTTQMRTAVSWRPAPATPAPARVLPRFLGHRRRSVALPSIQADLGFGATGITWVVNAYVLTFGSLLLMSGRAADLFGRRRMFIAGSTLFTAGTLVAAAAAHPATMTRWCWPIWPSAGCARRSRN